MTKTLRLVREPSNEGPAPRTVRAGLAFSGLLEQAPAGCLLVDGQGVIRKANRSARGLLGLRHERTTAPVLAAFVGPDHLTAFYNDLFEMCRSDAPISREIELRRYDGMRFWVRIEGQAADVDTKAALISLVDITHSREARDRLAVSEARLRTLIQAMPDAIFVVRDGRIVYTNPAGAQATGLDSVNELLGRDFGTLVVGEVVPVFRALALQHHAKHEPLSLELRLRGNREFVASTVWMPVVLDGEPSVLCVARDETERRSLQARLGQKDRMSTVGVLAAGVAHEVNNPLTYVTMSLGEILQGLQEGDEADREALVEFARQALDGTKRVARIVQDLRSFAREDDELQSVDVNDVARRAIELARPTVKHRARVQQDFGQVMAVNANDGRLTQIVLNLLLNAVDAVSEVSSSGQVVVSTAASREMVEIRVTDNGPGIHPDVRQRIFEPFFTTKDVGKGTGLGLFICHKYIHQYGGSIDVESTPGEGASFIVRLPATQPATSANDEPAREAKKSTKSRILVVDDEPQIRRLVALSLRRTHDVTEVGSVREAQRALGERSFDIILCDLLLPEQTGQGFHDWMVENIPAMADKMLFITGGACTPQTQAFIQANEQRVLPKPFSAQELRTFLAQLDDDTSPVASGNEKAS